MTQQKATKSIYNPYSYVESKKVTLLQTVVTFSLWFDHIIIIVTFVIVSRSVIMEFLKHCQEAISLSDSVLQVDIVMLIIFASSLTWKFPSLCSPVSDITEHLSMK